MNDKYVESCGKCKCYVATEDQGIGICRFMPPAVFPMAQQGLIQGKVQSLNIGHMTLRPTVPDSEWCAQFQPYQDAQVI